MISEPGISGDRFRRKHTGNFFQAIIRSIGLSLANVRATPAGSLGVG